MQFVLNGEETSFDGDVNISLLSYLREIHRPRILSAKNGCSAEGACGACMVSVNDKPKLACRTKMRMIKTSSQVLTVEGLPPNLKIALSDTFQRYGAFQCGFCTPGITMRVYCLLKASSTQLSADDVQKALNLNLCRCTGYVKIIKAIRHIASCWNACNDCFDEKPLVVQGYGHIGSHTNKYGGADTVLGAQKFMEDIRFPDMLFGALKFVDSVRARVLSIDVDVASLMPGVTTILTAKDIPGKRIAGLFVHDWPVMLNVGDVSHYVGDVVAVVVANNFQSASNAADAIQVEYEKCLTPITSLKDAAKSGSPCVHDWMESNILKSVSIGVNAEEIEKALSLSAFVSSGEYSTQRVEHAFLEREACIALPGKYQNELPSVLPQHSFAANNRIALTVLSQSQGVYSDRDQLSMILGIDPDTIRVVHVASGGSFGGREDLSVQGHAAIAALSVSKPVCVSLTRPQSLRMHPKRHPVSFDISVGCDAKGYLTAIRLNGLLDTGAYASVGAKVMGRFVTHATGGYFVPIRSISAKAVYTNNIPCGAMRGFGVNQAHIGIECAIDDLCKQGGFDRFEFRFRNALIEGLPLSTGQILRGDVAVRECLNTIKPYYDKHKDLQTPFGISVGVKSIGVGNPGPNSNTVKIEIRSEREVVVHHGWSEMGQGVTTIAAQCLFEETGVPIEIISVIVDTQYEAVAGMTTASRGTSLLSQAIMIASKKLKDDLRSLSLKELVGREYVGSFTVGWNALSMEAASDISRRIESLESLPNRQDPRIVSFWEKMGNEVKEGKGGEIATVDHYSYGFSCQMVVVDRKSTNVSTVIAVHDAGRVLNPTLFEGQIEGAVHMGLGYALSEDLPQDEEAKLESTKLRDCGVLRANETPLDIVSIAVEVPDRVGGYSCKGIGEIGTVPTVPATMCAYQELDGIRRFELPLKRKKKAKNNKLKGRF